MALTAQPIPIVVVDTTATFDDLLLRRLSWMQLLALSAKGRILIVVPLVVLLESVRHWRRQAEQTLKNARSEASKLKTSFGLDAGDGPPADLVDAQEHEQYVRDRLTIAGALLPGLPEAATPERLLARDLATRKPFSASGKGFRDALNWETILELAADPGASQIYWVSKNSDDFGDGNGGLNPDLVQDLADPTRVTWVQTLDELFKLPEFVVLLKGIAARVGELEQYLLAALAPEETDLPPLTTDDFIRRALVDAAENLAGETVDSDYSTFEPDGRFAELELPGQVEDMTIDVVDADPDTVQWQVYESFDGATLLIGATIEAAVTFTGFASRSDAVEPQGFEVIDWDWNDHVSHVMVHREAVLKFQLRVEEGVGVDYVEFESAEPVFGNDD